MALWTEGKLHNYRTGGQKPPLVLAHGFTENGTCWASLAQVLEGDYDVVMPDARGHGASGNFPNNPYPVQALAIDLVKVIHQLGLTRPALIGHSMGACMAAFMAANFPALVFGWPDTYTGCTPPVPNSWRTMPFMPNAVLKHSKRSASYPTSKALPSTMIVPPTSNFRMGPMRYAMPTNCGS